MELDGAVAEIRAFNRFYTHAIGVLDEGLLATPYSLAEARVIFELAQRDRCELSELRHTLEIDAGYLSRILVKLAADGLLERERSPSDGRKQILRLTESGRSAYEVLDERSGAEMRALCRRLSERELRRLLGAMTAIRDTLQDDPVAGRVLLRPPRSGDYGWVVQAHGEIYRREFDWDETFESLVARIVADYVDHRDPQREAAWIAEVDGERVGCVFCTKKEETIAQLRILLVDPKARGMGVGTRLVDECINFARAAGYERVMLWTNSVLEDARRIYERAGFVRGEQSEHHSFGHHLVGQNWWLRLAE